MTEQQAAAQPESKRITVAELKNLLDSGKPVQIIDVRSDASYAASNRQIPGSIRVSPSNVEAVTQLPRDRIAVTYCT